MNIAALWDSLVDAICRPPRDVYQIGELLGGRRGYCKLQGRTIVRDDLTLVNKRGLKLHCSHYKPSDTTAEHGRPIVIYCHCNSGSRRDAEEAFYILLPRDVTVFCLDFAGSGLSDGNWVTLGAHEVDDLEAVVSHLRGAFPDSTVGIWGRSMGAVTALMYSQRDPSIAGVVMDSPFARLTELMVELVDEQKVPIPKAFMRVALGMMRRSVRKRAGFNIDDVAPLNRVKQCHIPALFGHATEDTFVHMSHSQRLHDAYAGDKDFITFKGDHNSVRPQQFYSSALIFLLRALRWEHQLQPCPKPCLPLKSPVLAAMEAKGKPPQKGDNLAEETIARADSGKAEVSQSQRELAPPWNLHNAEQQADIIKGYAASHTPTSPVSKPHSVESHHSRAFSDQTFNRAPSPWQDDDGNDLVPARRAERAPWLIPASEVQQIDEKTEVPSETGAGEPRFFIPDCCGQTKDAAQAPAWGPARMAKRLLEEGAGQCKSAEAGARLDQPVDSARSISMPEVRDPVADLITKTSLQESQQQSVEGRFWQFAPDTLTPEDSDDSTDERALARAIEASIREQSRKAQAHSGIATQHTTDELRINSHIPSTVQNLSHEDAEEMMLVEAIKASLQEAALNGLLDVTPQGSQELPDIPSQGAGKSPGDHGHRSKSRALFWRRREGGESRLRSPAKHAGQKIK